MPGVFRSRPGCYAPLIFDACMIEILARRLCCDDPSSLADFDADSSDTNPSWSFLSYWKEGLASRNCFSPRLWLAAMSTGFKLDPSSISFRLLLPKSTAEGSFEDICTHPVALQRGVGLSKLASWDGTSAIMAEMFQTCHEYQESFNSKTPQSLLQLAWEPERSGFEVLPSTKTSM